MEESKNALLVDADTYLVAHELLSVLITLKTL